VTVSTEPLVRGTAQGLSTAVADDGSFVFVNDAFRQMIAESSPTLGGSILETFSYAPHAEFFDALVATTSDGETRVISNHSGDHDRIFDNAPTRRNGCTVAQVTDGAPEVAEADLRRRRDAGDPQVLVVAADVTNEVADAEADRRIEHPTRVMGFAQDVAHDFGNTAQASGGYAEVLSSNQDPALVEQASGRLRSAALRGVGEPRRIAQVAQVVNGPVDVSEVVLDHVAVAEAPYRGRDYVAISVTHDGPGIPPDMVDRVFDPFVTGQPGTGTGLGLYLIQENLFSVGGWVPARNTDHGAELRLLFRHARVDEHLVDHCASNEWDEVSP
jgi:hypothetical protein